MVSATGLRASGARTGCEPLAAWAAPAAPAAPSAAAANDSCVEDSGKLNPECCLATGASGINSAPGDGKLGSNRPPGSDRGFPRPVCRSGEFSGSGGAESVGDRNATRGDDWRSVTLTGGEVRRTIGGCGGIGGSCGSLPVPVPTPTGDGVGRPMGCDCSERAARNRGTGPSGIGKSRMSRRLRGT